MNRKILMATAIVLAATSCQSKVEQESNFKHDLADVDNKISLTDCDITFDGVRFTKSLNGGDSLVTITDSILNFDCEQGRDFFSDPNMKLSNHTIPAILSEVDNTKPFTLSAKVTPRFSEEGTYNAADLLVFASDSLYQKLCFEQDERGNHRVVSVRTVGTSDDNNHDVIMDESVFLKISSDARTIASYYSIDGQEWHMVRLYKNDYPDKLYIGIASQAPQKGNCLSTFSDMKLDQSNVADFRMGK